MKPTTGVLALMAGIGGGFRPADNRLPHEGVDQGDGTYMTEVRHQDGRTLTLTTRPGNGWQLGALISAVAGGSWNAPEQALTCVRWQQVRALLALHEPGRDEPYCGGEPIRQARALTGRERDILCRVLRQVLTACTTRERYEELSRLVYVESVEMGQLAEIMTVLNARDD